MPRYEKDVQEYVDAFNRVCKPNPPLLMDKLLGRFRIQTNGGSKDISPRLKGREMVIWLYGFYEGYIFHGDRNRE